MMSSFLFYRYFLGRLFIVFFIFTIIGKVSYCRGKITASSFDPLAFGPDKIGVPEMVSSPGGIVVSAQSIASQVGADILKKGGNAVDAAVAVSYALSVVYPAAGSIGGGGFMLIGPSIKEIKNGKEITFIDFRERAPEKSYQDMFLDSHKKPIAGLSAYGGKAIAVPGVVSGLETIRKRWGKLSRKEDMQPAILLAEKGYILRQGDIDLFNIFLKTFYKDKTARNIFLRPDGTAFHVGDRLIQSKLAQALKLIEKEGEKAFYEKAIAKDIVETVQEQNGILTMGDLLKYKTKVSSPLICSYRGYTIHAAPPPSAGGVALCEILGVLEGYNMHDLGLGTANSIQKEVEAMRHAYADRQLIGDPYYVHNTISRFLNEDYWQEIRKTIKKEALNSDRVIPGIASYSTDKSNGLMKINREKKETTHFSVIDKDGMTVSATITLDGWFGSGVMSKKFGIWMNDEMDDFSVKVGAPNLYGIVGSEENAIVPGKTPLSSMNPLIVTKDKHPIIIMGSPGGSRIPTTELSVLTGLIDYNLSLKEAVMRPRIHEQWKPSYVELEPDAVTTSVEKTLINKGYDLKYHRPWGMVEAIMVGRSRLLDNFDHKNYAVSDSRHQGGGSAGE